MSPRLGVVVGASGGIGAALAEALLTRGEVDHVAGLSRGEPQGWAGDGRRTWFAADTLDEASLAQAAQRIADLGAPSVVLIATGALHGPDIEPEKTYRAMTAEMLAKVFAINAIGPALAAKHLLPLMPRRGRSLFAALSARVGSIGDNRLGGWYAYRASKAALNQMVHTLAIGHRRTHPDAICVTLHPGTVRTRLSDPFAPKGKRGAHLLSPDRSANALLDVLAGLSPEDSGGFFAWDGKPIPW